MAKLDKSDTESIGTVGGDDGSIDSDTAGSGIVVTDLDGTTDTEAGTGTGTENGDTGHDPLTGVESGAGSKPAGRGGRQSSDNGNRVRGKNSAQGSKTPQKVDIKAAGNKLIAQQLAGLHAIAGLVTGQPHICAISQEQADAMVTAVMEVMAQYKIKPNPKALAWTQLAGVLGVVYAPKVLMFRDVAKRARANNVQPIRQPDQAAPAAATTGQMQFG